MAHDRKLSNHCLADHKSESDKEHRPPFTPIWLLRMPFIYVDRLMHFTGVRGAVWRLLGVTRSSKNPNVCNI